MQVYGKILVTLDCSPVDEAILGHVTRLARQNRAKVFLLHVVHAHTLDQNRALREKAEPVLADYRTRLRSAGLDVSVVIRTGEPEKEILSEIEAGDYDLVAMAMHGHGFMGRILFGSVSKSLKRKITIPLLLLRAE